MQGAPEPQLLAKAMLTAPLNKWDNDSPGAPTAPIAKRNDTDLTSFELRGQVYNRKNKF